MAVISRATLGLAGVLLCDMAVVLGIFCLLFSVCHFVDSCDGLAALLNFLARPNFTVMACFYSVCFFLDFILFLLFHRFNVIVRFRHGLGWVYLQNIFLV